MAAKPSRRGATGTGSEPVLRVDLEQLLRDGEGSGVEFKEDELAPQDLAKSMVALTNLRGGRILLGVTDDGTVAGAQRPDLEEWVLTVARDKIRPPVIPFVERVREVKPGHDVVVVTVDEGYAVHARWHNNMLTYYVRVGRQSREASTEELARIQQRRGDVRAELRPVPGAALAQLDEGRLEHYFAVVRGQAAPTSDEEWARLLRNTELMVDGIEAAVGSVAGVVLFGSDPRLLPHAAISATRYTGLDKGYAAQDRQTLRGPVVPTASGGDGLVDQALSFVERHTGSGAGLAPSGQRVPLFPHDVLREVLVNAVVHRDYSLTATDIEVSVYDDRVEVISPGRLPNGVTVDGMRDGVRAARNQILKDTLRDLGYMEHAGLGIPRTVIAGMRAHNGTEVDLEERGERFLVRLRA